jgi:hypothetical protein
MESVMSYTIVLDQAEQQRQIENRINAVVRHCRIGKVRAKTPKNWGKLPISQSPHFYPYVGTPQPQAWWQNPIVSTCSTSGTH